jgi:hypothetical protein
MDDVDHTTTEYTAIRAVLEGGPDDIPETLRVHWEPIHEFKLKIPHRGGYEHFEREPEDLDADGPRPVIYRWTARTRIAE